MNLIWMPLAKSGLRAAHAYIAKDNPVAAEAQLRTVLQSVNTLRDFPELGKPGRVDGTREWVIPQTAYIAAYKRVEQTIYVLALKHGAQRWPTTFSTPNKRIPPRKSSQIN